MPISPQPPPEDPGPRAGEPHGEDQEKASKGGFAPDQLQQVTDALLNVLTTLGKAVGDFGEVIKKTDTSANSLSKKLLGQSSELRQHLAWQTTITDKVKLQYEYQKKLLLDASKGALTNKQVLLYLEEIAKLNQEIGEHGFVSKEHRVGYEAVNAELTEMRNTLQDVGTDMNALASDSVKKALSGLGAMAAKAQTLGTAMKGVQLKGFQKDIAASHKALQNLFNMPDRTAKFRAYGDKAADMKSDRIDRERVRNKTLKEQKAEIDRRLTDAGIAVKDRKGQGTADALKAHGLSGFAHWIHARSLAEESEGGKAGFVSRMGHNLLTRGDGSLVRGALSAGAEGVESLAGSAASLISKGAPLLAFVELTKMAFDKNQVMNKELHDKLGKSGIYSGGGSVKGTYEMITKNLMSGGAGNSLGIGYEKNLAIMASLSDAGLSNKNLGRAEVGASGPGFLNNSFGTMQRNVYAYGKMAGLDSSTTMTQTIKLITQYKQSLSATEDFFVTIRRDAEAANITTTEYIRLIDDVNSHYDRYNKLLLTTVDTMRLLSLTGRHTAEDLKDNLDTITNHGKDRTMEQNTLLYHQILTGPDKGQGMANSRSLELDDSIDKIVSAMEGAKRDEQGHGWDKDSVRAALQSGNDSSIITSSQNAFGDDVLKKQVVTGAVNAGVKNTLKSEEWRQNMEQAQHDPWAAALKAAQQEKADGKDLQSETYTTGAANQYIAQRLNIHAADLLDPAKMAGVQGNLAAHGMSGALGGSDQDFRDARATLYDSAYANTEVARRGMKEGDNDPELKAFLENMRTTLVQNGQKIEPGAAGLKKYMDNDANRAKAIDIGVRQDSTWQDAYHNPVARKALHDYQTEAEKKVDRDKAAEQTTATMTTNDRIADAFVYLFLWLKGPLDTIASVVNLKWGNNDANKDLVKEYLHSGNAQMDLEATQRKLAEVEQKPDEDPTKKKELDILKPNVVGLQNLIRMGQDGTLDEVGPSTVTDMQRFHDQTPPEKRTLDKERGKRVFGELGLNTDTGAGTFTQQQLDDHFQDVRDLVNSGTYSAVLAPNQAAGHTTYIFQQTNVGVQVPQQGATVTQTAKKAGEDAQRGPVVGQPITGKPVHQ